MAEIEIGVLARHGRRIANQDILRGEVNAWHFNAVPVCETSGLALHWSE